VVRVVLDNLNTHKAASLYEVFVPAEARGLVKMAEIELERLAAPCLERRIADEGTFIHEVGA
jgi:hypothetical protein